MTEDCAPLREGDAQEEGGGLVSRPQPHSRDVTPSGIEIEFFWKPKRKYEIRRGNPDNPGKGSSWKWREVPSISTIADVFPSDALTWWGQGVGIDGVLTLFREGALRLAQTADGFPTLAYFEGGRLKVAKQRSVLDLMKQYQLRTNDQLSHAGDRGSSVHEALEVWANQKGDRVLPDPEFFPPEERGYVKGLCMFLEDLEKGEPEIIATERMVASVEHGFAGRYDLEFRTTKPCEMVYRWQPKRGPKRATLQPSLVVPDLKTSKYVYDKHFAQAEGYELGRLESGYEPSDARAVIHVHPGDPHDPKQPDGPYYQFVRSDEPEKYGRAFLAALSFLNALEEL